MKVFDCDEYGRCRPVASAHGFKPLANGQDFLPWVNDLKSKSGVYIIREKGGRVLYVGESHTNNLAKTIKRHFWTWRDDPERKHHVYQREAVLVKVRVTPSNKAVSAQDSLIRRLKPRDNLLVPEPEQPF